MEIRLENVYDVATIVCTKAFVIYIKCLRQLLLF